MPRPLPDTGLFVIRIGNDIITLYNWKNIPNQFDNLIRFEPDVIPPPHAEGERELNEVWLERFDEVFKRSLR